MTTDIVEIYCWIWAKSWGNIVKFRFDFTIAQLISYIFELSWQEIDSWIWGWSCFARDCRYLVFLLKARVRRTLCLIYNAWGSSNLQECSMLIPKQKFSGHDSSFKHHQMRGKMRKQLWETVPQKTSLQLLEVLVCVENSWILTSQFYFRIYSWLYTASTNLY